MLSEANCVVDSGFLGTSDLLSIPESEIPLYTAFEIFRGQLALTLGMDLDTYLYGDYCTWVDAYLYQWRRENDIFTMSLSSLSFDDSRIQYNRDVVAPSYIGSPPNIMQRRVTNNLAAQYRGIAQVRTQLPPVGRGPMYGTGFFVRPDMLLTAAHLVYDFRHNIGWHSYIIVSPSRHGVNNRPFGYYRVPPGFAVVSTSWIFTGNPNEEWGVIVTRNRFPSNMGHFNLRQISHSDVRTPTIHNLRIIGYPNNPGRHYIYSSTGGSVVGNAHFLINKTGGSGFSGSPVICQMGTVVGIVLGGYGGHALAVPMSAWVADFVRTWR